MRTRCAPRGEFASATLQRCTKRAQGDASRPPVSERLPPGPPRAPRPRHAPHRTPRAPAARTSLRRAARAVPPSRLAAAVARLVPGRPPHAPREYRCVPFCQEMCGGAARTARRGGGRSCALRHASVSPAAVLARSAARHLQSRSARAPDPRCLRCRGPPRHHNAAVLMPFESAFSHYL